MSDSLDASEDSIAEINRKNDILFSKLFWPVRKKKCSSDREKLLEFETEGWELAKIFEVTRTIHLNGKMSELRMIF